MLKKVHHGRKQETIQCLRTTLVKFPDDTRGRRRAKIALDILRHYILNEANIFVRFNKRLCRTNFVQKWWIHQKCLRRGLMEAKIILMWAKTYCFYIFDLWTDVFNSDLPKRFSYFINKTITIFHRKSWQIYRRFPFKSWLFATWEWNSFKNHGKLSNARWVIQCLVKTRIYLTLVSRISVHPK